MKCNNVSEYSKLEKFNIFIVDIVSTYIKTAKPTAGRTRARSRSRSRSRSMSRRSVAPVIQENDNQNEAEEPLKVNYKIE